MKVVTVGTSKITSTNIAEMRMAGIEVFACVSRDLERARKFAEENNVAKYSNDYDTVLRSNEYDFVYIGLPNNLHYEYSKKALQHGKNVICEKPFCLNQKQARDLLSCALSNGVYIFENMKVYHSLAYKQLKKDIELIKPIKTVTLNFSRLSSVYDKFKYNLEQTALSLEHGSGALMDINCYNISFVVGLFGLPLKCNYIANKTNGIDTSGVAILNYDGFIANLIAAKDSNGQNFVEICGENGYIYSDVHSSRFDHYTINFNIGDKREVNYKENYPFVPMHTNFKSIYENHNTYKYDTLMKYTFMEMKVLDDLRASANILFKNN